MYFSLFYAKRDKTIIFCNYNSSQKTVNRSDEKERKFILFQSIKE